MPPEEDHGTTSDEPGTRLFRPENTQLSLQELDVVRRAHGGIELMLSSTNVPDIEEALYAVKEELREIFWRRSYFSEMPKTSLDRLRKTTQPSNGQQLRFLRHWDITKRRQMAESKRQKIRDRLDKIKASIAEHEGDLAKIKIAVAGAETKNNLSTDEEAGKVDLEEVQAMAKSLVIHGSNRGMDGDDKLGAPSSKDDEDSDSPHEEDEEEPEG